MNRRSIVMASMNRAAILHAVCAMRRSRDRCLKDNDGPFLRGMSAGYHLAAHILWRELRS